MTDQYPARSETFVANEVAALPRAGWAVRVEALARPGEPAAPQQSTEAPIHYWDDDPPARQLVDLARLALRHPVAVVADLCERRRWSREEPVWALRRLAPAARRLARTGERHVHVHFAGSAALNALRLARLIGASFSVTAHAYDIFQRPANLREKLERAAFATSGCDYNVAHLRTLVSPPAAGRIHRVVMGVDGERFGRRRPPAPGAERVVIAVGRLVEKKGFGDLIDAVAQMEAARRPDRVLIAGDGPLRDELHARIAQRGLDGCVQVLGWRNPDRVRELLDEATVLAMPSVVASDGDRDSMPVVVKEALAMEVPVVATAEVGLPEVVRPEWGRLVAPGDPLALSEGLSALLALTPERRAAMGAAGRRFVLEHCSVEREAARLGALLEDALEQRPIS